jgi:D-glycero-alpha-D-manno-heptose-7-phosphate kinase
MIITRTPFRITLGGGGTDLPFFYQEHGGSVLSMSINKYMFVCLNRRSVATRQIVIRYSRVEVVDSIDEIEHPLAREALRFHGLRDAIELTSIADMPGNAGLGSSGAYLVGLLTAIRAYKRLAAPPTTVAEEACHLEMDVLRDPVGKQDQYIAALGGFQNIAIDRAGRVVTTPLAVDFATATALVSKAHIYYTGVLRSARGVLKGQDDVARAADGVDRRRLMDSLCHIKEIGDRIHGAFVTRDLDAFGQLMDEHWSHKRRLSRDVSLSVVDQLYDQVKARFGVLGGKIIGAGGGGFLMLYCPERMRELDAFMAEHDMPLVNYFPTLQGSRVVSDLTSFDDFDIVPGGAA